MPIVGIYYAEKVADAMRTRPKCFEELSMAKTNKPGHVAPATLLAPQTRTSTAAPPRSIVQRPEADTGATPKPLTSLSGMQSSGAQLSALVPKPSPGTFKPSRFFDAARFVNLRETPAIAVGPGCSETAPEPGSTGAVVRHRTILVPTDFSEDSRNALRHAMAWANAFGAQIVLLHVFQTVTYPGWPNLVPPNDLDEVITRSQRQLDMMCKQEKFDSHLEVFRLVHISDTPAEEIIEVARDLKADLIVTAVHAHAKSKGALPGATAAHIVGHAPCPVLLVPLSGARF